MSAGAVEASHPARRSRASLLAGCLRYVALVRCREVERHMTEVVSDDAPPAVLFRLSYRTQNHYRSGHRSEDSREQVVNSMRGWWEIDRSRSPEPRRVKHAVRIPPAGVTLAVVRIGDWKSAHRRRRTPHDTGRRPRATDERIWTNPLPSVRWAFDVADDPADIVHRSASVKLVPEVRDTIKSYWPDSPDDNNATCSAKPSELFGLRLLRVQSRIRRELRDDLCRQRGQRPEASGLRGRAQ